MSINGSVKWIVGIIIGAFLTGAVALGGWNLNKTASIPEKYSTKEELKEIKEDAQDDRDKIRQDVADKFDQLSTEQRYIRDSVDDIKNILINRRNNSD